MNNVLTNYDTLMYDLCAKYDCTKEDIGMDFYGNGLLAIKVKEESVKWFFNELELIHWLQSYTVESLNEN